MKNKYRKKENKNIGEKLSSPRTPKIYYHGAAINATKVTAPFPTSLGLSPGTPCSLYHTSCPLDGDVNTKPKGHPWYHRGTVVAGWTAGQLVERSILHQGHDS